MKQNWQQATDWESSWWSDCCNTFSEETKQLTYAKKIGLTAEMVDGKYPSYDLENKFILDIGGGPVSMLLKCSRANGSVADPCNYPHWVAHRYVEKGINYYPIKGEEIDKKISMTFDEVWIYNVLQHTDSPEKIIKNAKAISKIIRIFEWVNLPVSDGHIHTLTKENLDKWLGGEGKVETLHENYCHGDAYYGIFKGDLYAEI